METSRSVVEYFGLPTKNTKCCYCKSVTNSSISHGMWGHQITVYYYKMLIDRGWRRCGRYLYKPVMNSTCCPQYTIRLNAELFLPNKSHIKVARKFNNYIRFGQLTVQNGSEEQTCEVHIERSSKKSAIASSEPSATECNSFSPKETACQFDDKPRCRKAKVIRKERALMKLKSRQQFDNHEQSKSVAVKTDNMTKLEKMLELSHEHGEFKHRLDTKLVESSVLVAECNQETFEQEYAVFVKYQTAVHHDTPEDLSRKQFKRFLINSPLTKQSLNSEDDADCAVKKLSGSYHQQYFIDGRLFMVGVLDFLPDCISSVYLFYDPEFAFLSPGTLSALYEISDSRKMAAHYYMGYYIHNCAKMRYKSQFRPSHLLCPLTFKFCPIDDFLVSRLDANKYVEFGVESSDAEERVNSVDSTGNAGDDILVWLGSRLICPLSQIRASMLNGDPDVVECQLIELRREVQEFIQLVGVEVTKHTIFRSKAYS